MVPGSIIDGKYRVERELSRGGMGTVYVATHQHLGTEVAIKLSHGVRDDGRASATATTVDADDVTASGDQRRFLREARLAAHLRHPNIVQVLDFGVVDGVPYLVMELVPGESLRARLERAGRLSPAETVPIVEGIAAALAAAHAEGVVHRDLKPENVVLDARADPPQVKVVDFGLATGLPDDGAPATSASAAPMAGTPAYLSPEQASGLGPVTAASDRWALGVIAFECLTGRTPFTGEALGELILQICAWAPPTPSTIADVPDGFDAWFAQACAREPADRFATATAMSAALAQLGAAAGAPRPKPPPRRGPRRWLLGAAVAAALAAAAVVVAGIAGIGPTRSVARAGAVKRIAVLPIASAADAGAAQLASSVTGELITGLAARTDYKLIARASVARFPADGARDLRAAFELLHVDRVVVGTLTRGPAGLTLAVELIDADLTLQWTQRFTRDEAELQQLVDDATRAIAGKLGTRATAPPAPRDPAAYVAFLNGKFFWAKRDHDSLLTAIRYFEDATRRDPNFARAWVGLADCYLMLNWVGPTPIAETHPKARAALGRALVIDPDSSEAHAARGAQLLEIDWDFRGSEAAYRRAIELDPDNPSAHQWLGELLIYSHRYDEADAEMQIARDLDPMNTAFYKNYARVLYDARRYRDAEAMWRKSIELDPGQPWGRYGLGYALGQLGRYDEALAEMRADPVFQSPAAAPLLAVQELWVAWKRGDRAEMDRLLPIILDAHLERFTPWTMAFVYALCDRTDEMYAALDQAIIMHDPYMLLTAVNPEFDRFRGDPRFTAILKRLGV